MTEESEVATINTKPEEEVDLDKLYQYGVIIFLDYNTDEGVVFQNKVGRYRYGGQSGQGRDGGHVTKR